MVQQDTATVEQPTESGNALDDILRLAGEEPEPIPSDDDEEEEPEADPEGDEPEVEEEGEEDDADEPSEAIKPPVSLNKEQRAAFEQLPPELQKVWAETEAQRNEQVRSKTTEAAEATRNATSQAQGEVADISRRFAAELEVYAEAFRPMEPDLALLGTDPAAYAQQVALAKQMGAQYQELMQRANVARGQADQFDSARVAEQVKAEQARLRTEWPDILDPDKQGDLWRGIVEIGDFLGFNNDMLQNANAGEMLALKRVSDLKAKADKWDAFQTAKMTKVRAARDLPRASAPGTAPTRNLSNQAKADAAFKRARTSRSGIDYADFLEASGVKL
jgi:hypothetical protein